MKSIITYLLLIIFSIIPMVTHGQSVNITKSAGSNWNIIVDDDTLSGTHRDTHTAYNRLINEAVERGVYDQDRSRAIRSAGSNWFVVADGDTLDGTYLEQYTAIQAMIGAVGDYDLGNNLIRAYQNEELRLSNTNPHFIRAVRTQELRLDRLDLYYFDETIYEEVVDTVLHSRESQLLNSITHTYHVSDENREVLTFRWYSDATFNDIIWSCGENVLYDEQRGYRWGYSETTEIKGERIDGTHWFEVEITLPESECEVFHHYIWSQDLNWGVRNDGMVDILQEREDYNIEEEPEIGVNQWVFTPDNFDVTDWTQYWHGSSILSSDESHIILEDVQSGSNVWINNTVPYTNDMEVFMISTTEGATPHIRMLATDYGYAQDIYYSTSLTAIQYAYWNNSDPTVEWRQNMYTHQLDIPVDGSGEYVNKLMRVRDGSVYIKSWFGDNEPPEWMYITEVGEPYLNIEGGLGIGAHSIRVRYIEYLSVGINGSSAPRK